MMTNSRLDFELLSEMTDLKERTHLSDDLELAAEIGKNLLERNKELEYLLKSSHQYLEEQALKNEFLTKQLDTLREVNESRNKAFEQMETTALELQKANHKLQSETNTMKKRYKDLAEMVESMDLRCEDYRKEIDDLQKERVRLQRDLSMALSFREESETSDIEPVTDVEIQEQRMNDDLREEKEKDLEILNAKISKLKEQHFLERNKREELEYELSELIHENQNLESQLRAFADSAEEWKQVNSESTFGERVADILPTATRSESTEELDDDSFVVVTQQLSRQSSAVSDHSAVVVLSPSEEKTEMTSTSFFSELGEQYHELVRKYDALLDKCKLEGLGKSSVPIPMVQRAVQVSPLPSPLEFKPRYSTEKEQTDGNKNSEYKKMFEQIYTKLEESKNFQPASPKKVPREKRDA